MQVKEDGWWLVLGNDATQELHAIKRTSFGEHATARLMYTAADAAAAASHQLHLVSASSLLSGAPCHEPLPELTDLTCHRVRLVKQM